MHADVSRAWRRAAGQGAPPAKEWFCPHAHLICPAAHPAQHSPRSASTQHNSHPAPSLPATGAVQIEELRLAGGPSPSEGRVELRLANSSGWGTLCGAFYTERDVSLAQLVCRELGYEPSQALARGGGIYGDGGLPAVVDVDTADCSGEDALEDCQLQVAVEGSGCSSPAFGVSCNGALGAGCCTAGRWVARVGDSSACCTSAHERDVLAKRSAVTGLSSLSGCPTATAS